MKRRSMLLAVSVLCAGILIMPYTVSLFSAQHDWKAADDVNCITCHTDIVQPGATYMHGTFQDLVDPENYCNVCHQIPAAGSSEGVTGNGGFDDEHAAVTLECLDCHEAAIGILTEDVWYTVGDPIGTGAYINITTEAHSNMTGEAWNPEGAWATSYLAGNNEACIACHTNITVETEFIYSTNSLNITATEDDWGNWTVAFEVDKP
ncbi:MAG: hypothetical protein KAJ33_00125 [Thermoplasmata archaeon]|nr:hypothetical protein [Thermoplasmata archaeon]